MNLYYISHYRLKKESPLKTGFNLEDHTIQGDRYLFRSIRFSVVVLATTPAKSALFGSSPRKRGNLKQPCPPPPPTFTATNAETVHEYQADSQPCRQGLEQTIVRESMAGLFATFASS